MQMMSMPRNRPPVICMSEHGPPRLHPHHKPKCSSYVQKYGASTKFMTEACFCPGTLPEAWAGFNNITNIQAFNNSLNGSLPASWGTEGHWPNFASLELQHNRFTGQQSACAWLMRIMRVWACILACLCVSVRAHLCMSLCMSPCAHAYR